MAHLTLPEQNHSGRLDVIRLVGPPTREQYVAASATALDRYLGEIAYHLPESVKLAPKGERALLAKTEAGYLVGRYIGDRSHVIRWQQRGSVPQLNVAVEVHANEPWLGTPIYKEYGLTYEAGVRGSRPSIDRQETTPAALEGCPFIPRILRLVEELHEEFFHHYPKI
jgi:hypothetical protein